MWAESEKDCGWGGVSVSDVCLTSQHIQPVMGRNLPCCCVVWEGCPAHAASCSTSSGAGEWQHVRQPRHRPIAVCSSPWLPLHLFPHMERLVAWKTSWKKNTRRAGREKEWIWNVVKKHSKKTWMWFGDTLNQHHHRRHHHHYHHHRHGYLSRLFALRFSPSTDSAIVWIFLYK